MSEETYFPQIFLPKDLQHAKEIILSSDPTGEKWVWETEYTVDKIIASFNEAGRPIEAGNVLIDYGCGIGRIAEALIKKTGCIVVGVDISPGMLGLALTYVNSANFIPCPQKCLPALIGAGMRVSGAFSVWTLQHCLKPDEDLFFIEKAIEPGGLFFVVNKYDRYVPVAPENGWARFIDDKANVKDLLQDRFEKKAEYPFPTEAPDTLCAVYRKKSVAAP
jgi:SAM-dependent methyltransferase